VESGTDYTKAGLAARAVAVLSGEFNATSASSGSFKTAEVPGATPGDGPSATDGYTASSLAGCLTALAVTPGETATGVDVARWNGTPALIVLEPYPRDQQAIYVVRRNCSASVQVVLFFETVGSPSR
jgi:hypothetical protein